MNNRIYKIFFCSDHYFDNHINLLEYDNFTDIIRNHDKLNNPNLDFEFIPAPLLVINSNDYLGINESANLRLFDLIIDITNDNATIYIQNPTDTFLSKMKEKICKENYTIDFEKLHYIKSPIYYDTSNVLHKNIINEIIQSINFHDILTNNLPLVILLYGKSGVGKTHLVHDLSIQLTGKNPLRFQLSNYQNLENLTELFGENISSDDMVFKLMKRNTNIILLDEFDKTNPIAYNTFYRLFDEKFFGNRYRTTNIQNLVIFCTTNYQNINDIEENLPAPIFNRIDKYIYVPNLDFNQLIEIIEIELHLYIHNIGDEKIRTFIELNIKEIKKDIYINFHDLSCNQLNYRVIKKYISEVLEKYVFAYNLAEKDGISS
ncbi:SpoVK/Ycf46/Vps4 family AAA+-type ATPase [Bacilli bacterium PM5-9]|nr:SpoVK/Ycf46/Vps4 family AAA+-type ATPase [Bacilli bacterium PM5-9]